jgi:hypothetical protein
VFAYGALLWEIVTRQVPYDGLEPGYIKEKVINEEPLKMPYGSNKQITAMINDCRQFADEKRPTFDKIVAVLETVNASQI